jgi:Rod binding domain-containing protein
MRDGSFQQALRMAKEAEPAKEVAQKLVSLAFIEPVLAKLRETNQAAGPFAPSNAERRFGPLFDQHLADRITSSANFPLVESLRDHLTTCAKEDAHG